MWCNVRRDRENVSNLMTNSGQNLEGKYFFLISQILYKYFPKKRKKKN